MNRTIKVTPLLLLCLICGSSIAGDRALTNTWSSPYVTFRCTDINDVHWTTGFWADRFATCETSMVPTLWRVLSDPKTCPAYDNFLIAAGQKQGRHHGAKWFDGDFYKWLETAATVYGITRDPALDRQMDEIIAVIAQTQRPDGYIHSPVVIQERTQSSAASAFQERLDFETYNMGHLMTCACVHTRVTGKTSLLNVARKAADYLYRLYKTSPEIVANNAICPSHYMGVVEMYRTTHDPKYLELAKGLIEIRDLVTLGTDHNQDRHPFRKQTEAVGHAVRANYLYAGVADIYAETGDPSLLTTLETLWEDVTYRKLYVTGATGALYDGASPDGSRNHTAIQLVHQAYGRPYQLPNVTAYNESCATIGYALWNWRMLTITGQARYADVLEHVLYNGVLSTISLDGTKFFYRNTLRQVDDLPFELRWSDQRVPYISCFCCPPNIIRTMAEVSSYAYSLTDRGVWVNLYGSNVLNTQMADGSVIKLTQETDYPWGGTIRFSIDRCPTGTWSLFLRIPGWATDAKVLVNGKPVSFAIKPDQYVDLNRQWSRGDKCELILPMQPCLIEAHPLVEEARNQVAVQRGPIVYCLESSDLPNGTDIDDIALTATPAFKAQYDPKLLGGITVIKTNAQYLPEKDWKNTLYRKVSTDKPKVVEVSLIPYYAWGNRGESEMTVWIPRR
ncbi:MAG: glycoside hydrolase family 127 protein [Phycisphaerae bacterium]|nr:glycoside hydrolase family 127 protein [Phycisphaerae bacterium]